MERQIQIQGTYGNTKYRETRNFVKTQKHCRFPKEGKNKKQ